MANQETSSIFGSERDLLYMGNALELATQAFDAHEVPIGAVVVDSAGTVIGVGYNTVELSFTQTAHAECKAIAEAGKVKNDWRLQGCWLYVTLEPCAMCMHLILLSRLSGVVYAAASPVFGFHLDNDLVLQLYKKSTLQVISGICSEKAAELLKKFFIDKRQEKGK